MQIEDALTKWCPFARVATRFDDGIDENVTVAGAACNRGHPHDLGGSVNCVADKCMLWNDMRGQCGMLLHGSVIGTLDGPVPCHE